MNMNFELRIAARRSVSTIQASKFNISELYLVKVGEMYRSTPWNFANETFEQFEIGYQYLTAQLVSDLLSVRLWNTWDQVTTSQRSHFRD